MKILYEMAYTTFCDNEYAKSLFENKLINIRCQNQDKTIVPTNDKLTRNYLIVELEDSDNARFGHLD